MFATVKRETFEGENFREFAVLWPFVKVFSAKFGGVASFGAARASNLRTFSPLKVSLYHKGGPL